MPRYDALSDLQRLWLVSIAWTDLDQARRACTLALRQADRNGGVRDDTYDAFHDAAVVRYMRPFEPSTLPDGSGRTFLPAQTVFGAALPEAHTKLVRLRDKLVAHSDMEVKDVRARRLVDGANGPTWRIVTSSEVVPPNDMRELATHFDTTRTRISLIAQPLMRVEIEKVPINAIIDLRAMLTTTPPRTSV